MNAQELARQLRNIGPVTAQQLVNAGINTPAKLKKLGAKKTFMRIHESGGYCCLFNASYLYALEGAIRDCDWRLIPYEKKIEYKEFTKQLRESNH